VANQIPAIPRSIPSDSDITSAIALKHSRQHTVTTTSDHTSSATNGQILKANANGLPVDATNTDTDVADAVTKKHSQNSTNSFSEPSGTVSTHAVLATGVHGAGTGEVLDRSLINFATHEFIVKDEPLELLSGEVIIVGTDNKALVWCDSNKAMSTTMVEYITRQVIIRDEPFVLDYGTVAVIGYNYTASIWCDSNRFWDRLNNGFNVVLELNTDNCYVININEILDLAADDPMNRHLDAAAMDTGAVWIR
jgi:hypothetical protein